MRLAQIIATLYNRGDIQALATSARPQLGDTAAQMLGARLLPERVVTLNTYRERSIQFRAPIAEDIDRYSPAPKKASVLVGDFLVELASAGQKADITAEDLDVLISLLSQNMDFDAAQRITDFVANSLLTPLIHHNERQRWQAIVDALVILRGENVTRENIPYPNRNGQRRTLGALWNGAGVDAPADFFGLIDFMAGMGVTLTGIYASTRMRNRFLSNSETQKLLGGAIVVNGTDLSVAAARPNASRLNDYLDSNNLPPITVYDAQYRTQSGTAPFLRTDAMVFVGNTGAITTLDLGDNQQEILPNTLGYYAIGRVAGRPQPGRHILVTAHDDHPARVEGECVQEGLPVITQPDAIGVLSES